jgi:RNase P/RNase MRP subunit POP5
MASGKVSKNSTKGSKPKVMEIEKKVRPKKEYILVELTQEIYKVYREDLSNLNNVPVEDVIFRYGKAYLKIKNA